MTTLLRMTPERMTRVLDLPLKDRMSRLTLTSPTSYALSITVLKGGTTWTGRLQLNRGVATMGCRRPAAEKELPGSLVRPRAQFVLDHLRYQF